LSQAVIKLIELLNEYTKLRVEKQNCFLLLFSQSVLRIFHRRLCVLHEAEIFAKASNCFRTEATALLDSFFLVALLGDDAVDDGVGGLLLLVSKAVLATGVDIVTTVFKGANLAGGGVDIVLVERVEGGRLTMFGDDGTCCSLSVCGGDEQLNMSSPYLAIRSARLKRGCGG